MLDGHLLVDAHVHVPVLGSLKPAWVQWARDFGPDGILDRVWDADGRIDPAALDELFAEQGVDAALLFCEYSPKVTGIQRFEDLLPIVEHNPRRFRPVANVNPHLHFPIADELRPPARPGRGGPQAAPGARRLPVRRRARCGRRTPSSPSAASRSIVHCGTSSFPGSMNELADPELPAARRPRLPDPATWCSPTPGAAGGTTRRRSWRSSTRPSGSSCRGCRPSGCRSTSRGSTSTGWRGSGSSRTDWPGAVTSTNARAVAGLGLDDDVVAGVLGGNALRVYAGLDHLA